MAVDRTFKDGGSGKGQALRVGLDLAKFGDNLEKTHGTRSSSCLDCYYFKGINVVDTVSCIPGKKQTGLNPCSDLKLKV
jgi:hypothetical protein